MTVETIGFSILLGMVISFLAAIPVGAVNMAIVQATLNDSRRRGYMIGFGSTIMEVIYCGIPLLGFSYIFQEGLISHIMYIGSIVVLLAIGGYTIINRKSAAIKSVRVKLKDKDKKKGTGFWYGLSLCASNPMVLIFWAQISVLLHKLDLLQDTVPALAGFLIGVPLGTLMLYTGIIQIAHNQKQKVSLRWKARINLIVGLVFILLAGYLGFSYFKKVTNHPPIATEDHAIITSGDNISINVLSNDHDPEEKYMDIQILSQPLHGKVKVNKDNSINYTPSLDFPQGLDTFSYLLCDQLRKCDTGMVVISVNPKPGGQNDSLTIP